LPAAPSTKSRLCPWTLKSSAAPRRARSRGARR
jgi:hypothetical protein